MAKILEAATGGKCWLKLEGEIRVDLCYTLQCCMGGILKEPGLEQVVIDLSTARWIDSTALGTLARFAHELIDTVGIKPVLVSKCENITSLVRHMGLDRVFDIRRRNPNGVGKLHLKEQQQLEAGESTLREQVIEVHRTLIDMGVPESGEMAAFIDALKRTG